MEGRPGTVAARGDEESVLHRIEQVYGDLAPQMRGIADYLRVNLEDAAFLNTRTLAQRTGTSKASVVRFVTALGFASFGEMQRALAQGVRRRLSLVDLLTGKRTRGGARVGGQAPGGAAATAQSLLHVSLRNDQANLESLTGTNLEQAFAKAVDLLARARLIATIGCRAGYTMAYFAWFHFSVFHPRVVLARGEGENFLEETKGLGPGGIVIAYSFPRYARRTLQYLEFARKRRAKTVVFTDHSGSPAAALADVLLLSSLDGISFMESWVAPLGLTQALVSAVADRNLARTKRSLQEMDADLENFGLLTNKFF